MVMNGRRRLKVHPFPWAKNETRPNPEIGRAYPPILFPSDPVPEEDNSNLHLPGTYTSHVIGNPNLCRRSGKTSLKQ